jgi:hypothetical protein
MFKVHKPYSIGVVDIGSPKLGNIGWCIIDGTTDHAQRGAELDDIVPLIAKQLQSHGMILGLEAPLFIPLREDLILATKGRRGEGRRPWSAGAGAQVLAMNLPIMTYLFRKIKKACPDIKIFVNEDGFEAERGEIMIFEALVSGSDKGTSHIDDAEIMAQYCLDFSHQSQLPPSILEKEDGAAFLNLVATSLLHCGLITDTQLLHKDTPIYKPSLDIL